MAEQSTGGKVAITSAAPKAIEPSTRIVALEVRSQRTGFIALEGSGRVRLLDWGVRLYDRRTYPTGAACGARIAALLDLYAPSVVVLRRGKDASTDEMRRWVRAIVAKIATEARRRSITYESVTTKEVQDFFGRYGNTTKHAIARIVAERFPELAFKLPSPRRPWESESYNTVIFDAAATAMTFLG
jgi:hypothetical protein